MIDRLMWVPGALVALASNLASTPLVARDIAGALSSGAFGDARRMVHTARRSPDLRSEKMVSRKYRCLWLCNPKVGSRSIMAALRTADPDIEVIRDQPIRDICALRPEVKDYYSFAFVRHPFQRALSFYWEVFFSPEIYAEDYHRYRKKEDPTYFDPVARRSVSTWLSPRESASPMGKEKKRQSVFHGYYGLKETDGFGDFCQWLNTPWGSDSFAERHFLSQHMQIRLGDGRLPDFIGRFENIDADLNRVAAYLGMPPLALPMLNTMDGWQSTPAALNAARRARNAQLTERNRALLRTRYAEDFELGGYSPA